MERIWRSPLEDLGLTENPSLWRWVMKGFVSQLTVALILALLPGAAEADGSPEAWLSWDSAGVVCDLPEMPTGPTWLYVQLRNVTGLYTCEFALHWRAQYPSFSGCYEFVTSDHPSGSGGDCTWMMRGSQAEGMNIHGDGYWDLAIAGDECSTCDSGNLARVLFDFSSCAGDVSGHFCLEYLKIADCGWGHESAVVIGSAMVEGGVGAECPCSELADHHHPCMGCDWAVSVEGSTWGAVKALYK